MSRVISLVLAIIGALLLLVFAVWFCSRTIKPGIYYAVKNGDTAAVQQFINGGGDVNRSIKFDKLSPSLLGVAVGYGRVQTVELLLKNKADPNFIAGGFDCNPLVIVVDTHDVKGSDDPYLQIMRLLLTHGANPNLADQRGHHCPALYDAAEFGSTEMVKLLLAAGADVNATNQFGQTPLHAVKDVESARLLLAAGANCKALCYGETPADVALREKRLEVYEFLTNQCTHLP